MAFVRIAAAAAHFGRDLEFDLARIGKLIEDARRAGACVLVLPDAALGGYVTDLRHPDPEALPPALEPGDPVLKRVAALAADMVVCVGPDRRRRAAGQALAARYTWAEAAARHLALYRRIALPGAAPRAGGTARPDGPAY